MHDSATSQVGSCDGLQICVLGANWHCCVQHVLLAGSQTEPDVNLHVVALQHVEFLPLPGSQSSPVSTMPFPHIWRESVCLLGSGGCTHVMFVVFDSIKEPSRARFNINTLTWQGRYTQMFPMVQNEKRVSSSDEVGLMRNLELVSHWLVVSGQQVLVELQPPTHYNSR